MQMTVIESTNGWAVVHKTARALQSDVNQAQGQGAPEGAAGDRARPRPAGQVVGALNGRLDVEVAVELATVMVESLHPRRLRFFEAGSGRRC